MRALDTNVIVRLLVRDDEQQAQRSRAALVKAENDGETLLVTSCVVLELLWVLRSAYSFSREEVLDAMEILADLPVIQLEHHDVVRQLVEQGRTGAVDLADLLIGLSGRAGGCASTITFDRKLRKSPLFSAVT